MRPATARDRGTPTTRTVRLSTLFFGIEGDRGGRAVDRIANAWSATASFWTVTNVSGSAARLMRIGIGIL
jgi:hypothetical protein